MRLLTGISIICLVFVSACSSKDSAPEELKVPIAFLNLLPDGENLGFSIDDEAKASGISFKDISSFYTVPEDSKRISITDDSGQVLITKQLDLDNYSRYYFYLLRDDNGDLFLGTGERKGIGRSGWRLFNPTYNGLAYWGMDFLQTSKNLPFEEIAVTNISSIKQGGYGGYLWFDSVKRSLRNVQYQSQARCGQSPVSNEVIFRKAGFENNITDPFIQDYTNPNELVLPSYPERHNLGAVETYQLDVLLAIFDDPTQPKGYDGLIINLSEAQFID